MTEEMYKRLNNYLNTIFFTLDKNDRIFVDNLINFIIINNRVTNKLSSKTVIDSQKTNNLSFKDIIDLVCEILQNINPSYVETFKKSISNGELDFSYNSEYHDSHCLVTLQNNEIIRKEININRFFNYSDVVVLIHEFIHYTNSNSILSQTHSFLREFISIYFELFATKYLINNKKVDIEEININSRVISFLRKNNKFYNYIYILLAFEELGNINANTINDIKNILHLEDNCFEKECVEFIKELDQINNCYLPNEVSSKMTDLVTNDYRYIVGTLLAYYAIENCKLEDMVKLNDNIVTEKFTNMPIDDILNTIGIEMSDDAVNDAIEIIDRSIYEYEREKSK